MTEPQDLRQLRHLAWELAGRPYFQRDAATGEGRPLVNRSIVRQVRPLASWLAGPGFAACQLAESRKCLQVHSNLAAGGMVMALAPMGEVDYCRAHQKWNGLKSAEKPGLLMPVYARCEPRGEWILSSDPDSAYCPDQIRLYVTGRGLPRWSSLNVALEDKVWAKPQNVPDYAALIVEGFVRPTWSTYAVYSVYKVLRAPSAADVAMLRRTMARHRLGAI